MRSIETRRSFRRWLRAGAKGLVALTALVCTTGVAVADDDPLDAVLAWVASRPSCYEVVNKWSRCPLRVECKCAFGECGCFDFSYVFPVPVFDRWTGTATSFQCGWNVPPPQSGTHTQECRKTSVTTTVCTPEQRMQNCK